MKNNHRKHAARRARAIIGGCALFASLPGLAGADEARVFPDPASVKVTAPSRAVLVETQVEPGLREKGKSEHLDHPGHAQARLPDNAAGASGHANHGASRARNGE